MQPVLLQLGPLTFYSFGVFVALAFGAGAYVVWQLARRDGLPLRHLLDYSLYTAVAVLIGARLWYVLFRPDETNSFWELFTVGGGGLALPGGLLAGVGVLVLAIRRNREPVRPWLDVAAVGTAVGLAVGKVGSLLNGDGFGTVSSLPWAITFTDPGAPASIVGQALHPLQVYALALYAALAFGLWRLYERVRSGSHQGPGEARGRGWRPGTVFWSGILGVAVIQVFLEIWHSPLDALAVGGVYGGGGGLRVIFPTALILIAVSAAMLYRLRPGRTT